MGWNDLNERTRLAITCMHHSDGMAYWTAVRGPMRGLSPRARAIWGGILLGASLALLAAAFWPQPVMIIAPTPAQMIDQRFPANPYPVKGRVIRFSDRLPNPVYLAPGHYRCENGPVFKRTDSVIGAGSDRTVVDINCIEGFER